MPIREFKLSVKVVREGQPTRPYADSEYEYKEYEYEIEAENCNEYYVKAFCTGFLRYTGFLRHGYYEFSKIGENKYRYYVKEPFCD